MKRFDTLRLNVSGKIRIGVLNHTSVGSTISHCFNGIVQSFGQDSEIPASLVMDKCGDDLGIGYATCILIFNTLNIPSERIWFLPRNHSDYGYVVNGTWYGAVGEIQQGLYDTALPYFTPLNDRLEKIDFSTPVFYT